jgi:hypothetical protein
MEHKNEKMGALQRGEGGFDSNKESLHLLTVSAIWKTVEATRALFAIPSIQHPKLITHKIWMKKISILFLADAVIIPCTYLKGTI